MQQKLAVPFRAELHPRFKVTACNMLVTILQAASFGVLEVASFN
jgi:hypothetical protein